MSDTLYVGIYNTMTEEQHEVMFNLYMKGRNFYGHTWNAFSDIERAVAKILLLERSRKNESV